MCITVFSKALFDGMMHLVDATPLGGFGVSLTLTLTITLTLTLTRYYGAHFLGACEHDSRCLKAHIGSDNLKLDASSTGVSWWWQTCSQLGFLQRAPKKSYDADPFDAPMRSSEVTP